ncbi:MarR family winged helix-turn-helix transcriptional regulator [Streptomyces sp. NPDC054796]
MNAEFNRLAHEFAQEHRLHVTDVQALIVILDGGSGGSAEALAGGADGEERPPVTPGMLRERLNLTSGAVTACLDRLERAGHVRRTRDPGDRRVVHLHYEPRGMKIARAYFEPLARSTEAARGRFSEAELKTVVRFLAAMNEEVSAVHRE